MERMDETALIDAALKLLGSRLPPGWTVENGAGQVSGPGEADALFVFHAQSMASGSAIVEVRPNFAAADVERLLGGLTRRLREASGDRTILLVSEFLSPRARALLAEEGISYLDLTGNVRLVMQYPPIYVERTGADRRPSGSSSKRTSGLKGVMVGRVARFLAEVVPPYGVNEIERATGISRGYVSKLLDRLSDEALISREPRGPVESVDWPSILRVRGESVDLFRSNTVRTYISPNGARAAAERVAGSPLKSRLAVTGSFAAVRKAPIAAPALLAMYIVPDGRPPAFDEISQQLGLLRADEAADVALIWPANDQIVRDLRPDGDLNCVNLPQLVVDCLGGTGRMPAEGEAVLAWMQENLSEWQFSSLEKYWEKRQ